MRRLVPMLLLACSAPSPPECPLGALVVTETQDYSASGVGVLPLDGTLPVILNGSDLGGDPALVTSAGRHFFVARDRDTVFEIDACGHSTGQWSTRALGETNKTDPQDVAVASDGALWIPRLLMPSLLVLGRAAGETTIDLSKFDTDGDGTPEMSSIRILGSHAFVALERLTNSVSVQPSQIVVLDTGTLSLVKTITLSGRNPFGLMVESGTSLWLAEPGSFNSVAEPDAGIEVVDTVAMTSKLLITEATLGGSVAEVAVDGSCGAAILADESAINATSLVSFQLDGTNVKPALPKTAGFTLRGLLWTADGKLLLGDQMAFAVHTFTRAVDCALSAGPDIALPSMPALAFTR